MKFTPEKYKIPDVPMQPFIDAEEIEEYLNNAVSTKESVRAIIAKSLSKKRLSLAETAILINTTDPELVEEIKDGARQLKKLVYGNRIVLFAPLYIGNKCANNCTYCGFRASNTAAKRVTLTDEEIVNEVKSLEDNGQKRLILVYGEHAQYNPEFIAHTVRLAYSVKKNNGEIRRVNINAAPLDIEGFKVVKEAGIGTYQVFQETYHPEAYKTYHLRGKKADYGYRLTSLDRAQEAGLDDVGIGALFGLYDWRFEVMGLVRHTNHLEACYNVGPHTISFPRIKDASMLSMGDKYFVNDGDFAKLVAILRLAVPYTGMILTAREPVALRNEVIQFGVSQIDGGTKLELGSYSESEHVEQDLNRGQFRINDSRTLSEIISELLDQEMLPSFCTACYRLGRTGEHFMEFSVPGFIKRFCTPNAILTLAEYLVDYGNELNSEKGWKLIEKELQAMGDEKNVAEIRNRIELIKNGKRDLYF
ncbi:MAG TPA: [FeFe] hydrogenase H-cluster radical SAM maturase HydG [Bacteroidales bacterium]|nr:[FeFe] hydrogenase H-cluster radical SAM maturase HydG [Bacteroidales bacterium]HOH84580.1 [FeFe] hydrogenase H-cluster radical SAM maturase HydG [Bacteroidales bacterium]HPB24489.1 [FeFe] hydrogenase H-cluster radical SAM maturase HydG [Bacteroidales bacterium]HPI30547.1 [FeFe] hydrogenase H-cluster radical SAM maturase HydG [Bacteroidales bacterium]HQN15026.1 [FeFe] hydrogenase H-cluster radical SAM maturase HydG [Bacteroidales bacterium]